MNKHGLLLAILSGIFVGTSYIPLPPWAIFFAYIPLWIFWLRATSLKQVWWSGWICQFVLTLIGFNWVAHTVHEFGRMPLSVSYVALFGFCSFATLSVPIAGALWFLIQSKLKLALNQKIFLLPALMWIAEQSYPMIFDWHPGYTWIWAGFPAYHTAELIGFSGLSLLTYLAHLPFYYAYQSKGLKRLQGIAIFFAAFAVLNVLGYVLHHRLKPFDQKFSVLVVQANIGNLEKHYAQDNISFRDNILNNYLNLTTESLAKFGAVDFAIWPETAFPDDIVRTNFVSRLVLQLRSYLYQNNLSLITGAYGSRDTGQSTNSMFFLSPQGAAQEPGEYTKTELLAFGEYIPGSIWFPILKKWLPQVADFARGKGPESRQYAGLSMGPQICYEGLFDWFTRKLAQKNAQVIINVTNDSWYGTWQEPYQHLYMTLARAIEVRRPLVRSTNTGISTVILADGTLLEQSPLHVPWSNKYEVPYWSEGPQTLFSRWGYYLPWAASFILIVAVLVVNRGRGAKRTQ